jgi:eukaryotic-like serine/threonine-protein kinase
MKSPIQTISALLLLQARPSLVIPLDVLNWESIVSEFFMYPSMSSHSNDLYEFGPFLIDRAERILIRDGQPISLTPKAFEVLLALVERCGHIVEKEELMTVVWPGTIVEEGNLTHHVYILRKVLSEGTSEDPYIETIPRRGYRFVAEVKRKEKEVVAANKQGLTGPITDELFREQALPSETATSYKGRLISYVMIAMLALAGTAAWFFFRRQPVLISKDTILLADFDNKTGDKIFDEMLKEWLASQLQQSSYLNLFPEAQAQRTMQLMGRSPTERMMVDIAREICVRHGLKALIAGVIAPVGSHYAIILKAINSQNGEALAQQQVEADSRERVLQSLSQAAEQLREKLGESLKSIQQLDKPLVERVTTPKLEAYKVWTLGVRRSYDGKPLEAIQFYKRALEIDPDFAHVSGVLSTVYGNTGRPALAAEYAEKGYALKDRVSEFERRRILNFYHAFVTGNLGKRIETLTLQKQQYPHEWQGPTDLAMTYNMTGQYDKGAAEASEAIRLNPNFGPAYSALGSALLGLNNYAKAKEVHAKSLEQRIDNLNFHTILYKVAFIDNDSAGIRKQLDWAREKSNEHMSFDWQAGAAAFNGQSRKAQEFSRRAIDLAAYGETQEIAARYAAEQALRSAVFGDCQNAGVYAIEGLKLTRGRASLPRAALAIARCGKIDQATHMIDEMSRSYPEDTLINSIWLPIIWAAIDMQRGNAEQAVRRLQAASLYEDAAEFWPQFLRGEAYLKLGCGDEAAIEFQKILRARGQAPLSVLYPLASAGLGRAGQLTGDAAASRKGYQDFQVFWKDADKDLPALIEAKKYELVK